ncbi:hypothetical protein ACRASX_10110 [Flavobacterium sp. TMP13]|uniref:hypothetical protein n=1 Tax=Flavobacterium sp. TMP13 TaxID=3425950 RepID=UPI003D77B960
MKKLNKNSTLFMVVVLLMTVVFFASCSSDDSNATSDEVTLLSFGPSGQLHGAKIEFIGHNLDRVTSIKLEGAEVAKANFIRQSSEKIELIIPIETVEGKAILVYDGGEIVSKTIISFDVPFMISTITPQAKPGENITITGEYLNWVKSIVFADGIEVIEFVSKTMNQLVVTVPSDARTGPIQIIGGGTESYMFKSESDIKITLPMVTSLSPEAVKHTEMLTILGTDLNLVKSIQFANSDASAAFESQSATKIVVKVPVMAKDGTLKITAFSGVATETVQTVKIILPVITKAAPQAISVGAEWTLTGTDLDLVKEVIIPGAAAPTTVFVSQSATKIVLKVPEGSFNGAIKLKTINGFLIETTTKIEIAGLTDIPLARVIFDDAYKNGFGDWSWNEKAILYTTEVKEGSKSLRKNFAKDGLRFGGGKVSTEGMTELVFSIYGGEGLASDGKLSVMINEKWGITSVTIKTGQWTEFVIPLSSLKDLPKPNEINDLAFQNDSGYIIIDKVGLR